MASGSTAPLSRVMDWAVLLLYVAIVFLLVRPGSQGPKVISTIGSSMSSLIKSATGGGTWSGK